MIGRLSGSFTDEVVGSGPLAGSGILLLSAVCMALVVASVGIATIRSLFILHVHHVPYDFSRWGWKVWAFIPRKPLLIS